MRIIRFAFIACLAYAATLGAIVAVKSPWHWSLGAELPGLTDDFREIRCVYPLGVQLCGWR